MDDPDRRIFLYLRVTSDGQELARSKIRELAGLPTAMAELTGELLGRTRDVPRHELRLQYVEAGTGEALITLHTDLDLQEQIIQGRIPPRYQERMLDRPPQVDIDRFEERAGRELDETTRWQLKETLRGPSLDVLALIRSSIREDGSFHIRVPLSEAG